MNNKIDQILNILMGGIGILILFIGTYLFIINNFPEFGMIILGFLMMISSAIFLELSKIKKQLGMK